MYLCLYCPNTATTVQNMVHFPLKTQKCISNSINHLRSQKFGAQELCLDLQHGSEKEPQSPRGMKAV